MGDLLMSKFLRAILEFISYFVVNIKIERFKRVQAESIDGLFLFFKF